MKLKDTIAAVSTPPGRGGIGIVRISGAEARGIAGKVLRLPPGANWRPWTAMLAELPDAEGHSIDHVVIAYFAAPRSYTAEDIIEISCHGSPVVLRFALERVCAHGARLAEPGEFTLRAYLNGRIDLPRAEAVRDLIEATTLYQARIAAQQVERQAIRGALRATGGNKSETARRLKVDYKTLHIKMKHYGIHARETSS